jgi:hypothetical protein
VANRHIDGERVIPSREGIEEGDNPDLPFLFLENKSISRQGEYAFDRRQFRS